VMALKIDGKEEYAFLVNENRFDGELNSKEKVLQFLSNRYLNLIPSETPQRQVQIVQKTKEEIERDLVIEERNKSIERAMTGFVIIMLTLAFILILGSIK
jgi:hypothetical protein